MALHTFIIGAIFYTYGGRVVDSTNRLSHLHALRLIRGCYIVLAYLVSAVAKKDPVGRKPKKKVFSLEGLTAWEKKVRKELTLPTWATVSEVDQIDLKLAKIKGDLMCELIGTLALLIAHLRAHTLFDAFSAR
ncbi:hypothetical protein MPER_02236, partial [Moniliophthora perniciosa FA553]